MEKTCINGSEKLNIMSEICFKIEAANNNQSGKEILF